jgi:hypothetical protein
MDKAFEKFSDGMLNQKKPVIAQLLAKLLSKLHNIV